jgi:large subunit ribosomal protein L7/L12
MTEEKTQAQTNAEENAEEKKEEGPEEEKARTSEAGSPKEGKAESVAQEGSSPDTSKEVSREKVGEESVELTPELKELAKKYEKLIGEIEKLSVVELAELVKVLEKKFGVSAAAPVAAAAGGGEAEEKDSYNIMLNASGEQKINVIKVVREITGLGLKESKDIVEGAPKLVKEGVKKEEAEEFKKKLEEAGATVELQ